MAPDDTVNGCLMSLKFVSCLKIIEGCLLQNRMTCGVMCNDGQIRASGQDQRVLYRYT